MTTTPSYEGELPPNAIKVDSFIVGHGTVHQLDDKGATAAPILVLATNEGMGPMLVFSTGVGLELSDQFRESTLESASRWDPKLRELKEAHEQAEAQLAVHKARARRRLQILLAWYLVWLLVEVVIGAFTRWAAAGYAILFSLAFFGLAFLMNGYVGWWLNWRSERRAKRGVAANGDAAVA